MKVSLTCFLIYFFLCLGLSANAQWGEYKINFDVDSLDDNVSIDTLSNPNNAWQICKPVKKVFDSAYSRHRAILTDSSTAYRPDDTSSFTFGIEIWPIVCGHYVAMELSFYYKFDSDSLLDFGKVEISDDSGLTWYDMLEGDSAYLFKWIGDKPVLSGNSRGWKKYHVDLLQWFDEAARWWINYSYLVRFSFISDSVDTGKDGWMVDDIVFYQDAVGSVNELAQASPFELFPNPSHGMVQVRQLNQADKLDEVFIYDQYGKLVWHKENPSMTLKLNLPEGLYFLKLRTGQRYFSESLIIEQ